jgi:hypothetical protein
MNILIAISTAVAMQCCVNLDDCLQRKNEAVEQVRVEAAARVKLSKKYANLLVLSSTLLAIQEKRVTRLRRRLKFERRRRRFRAGRRHGVY